MDRCVAVCLSGKMSATSRFDGDDLRKADPKFQPPRFAQYLAAVAALDRFARDNYGKRVIDLAVRWVLDRGNSNIALWGARRPDQLASVSAPMGWHIDAAGMAEIDRILRGHRHKPRWTGIHGAARPARSVKAVRSDLETKDETPMDDSRDRDAEL